jgi:hypothetical protein
MNIGLPTIPNFAPSVSGALLSFGGAFLINQIFGNYWGIFDQSGFPILLADNVTRVGYQDSSKVSSAPVESGSFAHYNKVISPNSVTVQMTKGSGGVMERGAFLGIIKALAGSTDLFTVITPEAIYPNVNITSHDYSREATDGARLLKVNLHLEEIREVSSQYVKTETQDTSAAQNPGAQNPTNGGQQQAQPVQQQSALSSAVDTVSGWFN